MALAKRELPLSQRGAVEIKAVKEGETALLHQQSKFFAAAVCHEVRNAGSGMLGNLESVQRHNACITSLLSTPEALKLNTEIRKSLLAELESQGNALKSMGVSAEHQQAFVNDILNLSKLKLGKSEINTCTLDPKRIIKEALDMLKGEFNKKKIQICLNFFYEDFTVNTDAVRLRQVLLNLILNAIKFTPEGGEITISLGKPQVGTSDTTLSFSVKDTGIGMSEEECSHLFEPFQQANATTSSQYGGSGLGLAIAKEIVTLLGGTIAVKSQVGKGSEFTFSINCKNTLDLEKPPSPVIFSPQKVASKNINILVVEDDVGNQKLVKHILAENGYHCKIASNGQEAVEICAKEKIDMVFMDIKMPIMGGVEATKKIRELERLSLVKKGVPIVALSGSEVTSEEIKAWEMDDCMVKGSNKIVFLQKIERFSNNDTEKFKL